MNLTRLKTYAPAARNALITAVTRRAGNLGIQPGRVEAVSESGDVALIGGQPFPRSIVPLRKQLLDLIQRDGFDHTMESMAYTWFNRLVALRFMELHDGWLDHGYRVLSHPQGTPLPEILQHAEHVSLKGLDREEVIRLKLDGNRDEELYRLLLLAQCTELNQILPDVFSKLDDATILLLPDNLLHSDSVIRQLVAGSDAEDWQQVEVLGWLYQFYISEKKSAVDLKMKMGGTVNCDELPAKTQLFTPHWIVRYLVENSLGRLWLLNRPGSRLREHMPYYIDGEPETDYLKITKPEDIRLLDPAVGSGHMLTYAFDLLVLIYQEEGYAAADIPRLILLHNLHGLDLCPRAAQLAELALVFKAREKSRRFFVEGQYVRPNIIELRDVGFAEGELRDYIQSLGLGSLFSQPVLKLLHQFEEAKNFGSLIQPCLDEQSIFDIHRAIEANDLGGQLFLRGTHLKVLRVLAQAVLLTQRYHIVVANPPYLGSALMNGSLRQWSLSRFPLGQEDLFACFIERCPNLSLPLGYVAMIAPQSWMFIKGFESLRLWVVKQNEIVTFAHNGFGVFGADFGTAAFCLRAGKRGNDARFYISLREGKTVSEKNRILLSGENRYKVIQSTFEKVPTCIFAYWASPQLVSSFETGQRLEDIAPVRQGFQTGENSTFIRSWQEVSQERSIYSAESKEVVFESAKKWVPYNKGGPFRKWFGNNDLVVAFDQENYEILSRSGNCLPSRHLYFKEAVTWSSVTVGAFSSRFSPKGFTFSSGGACAFPVPGSGEVALGLLNSKVVASLLEFLGATINFNVGSLRQIPVAKLPADSRSVICEHVRDLIILARADWDNFETSWDFRDMPLLRPGLKAATLDASWRNWETQSTAAICQMQELETENNRLFIAAYGLESELQPEVPEAQITLFCNPASRYKRKAKRKNAKDDTSEDNASDPEVLENELSYAPEERSRLFRADTAREFLSYAVGCMMGRYSIDHPGLILANAGDSLREFLEKVGKPLAELSFAPDEDGIIPVLDGEWFEDDIVARAKEFLRGTFGEVTLNENLRFIEESLGKDLLTYFLNDFYKDHLQTYKNRPIYWLFSSGKQKAFQCLVYLHRYTPGTLARIRTEYAIPLQGKLAARINRLEEDVIQTSSSAARKKLQTELDKCKKQMVELLAFDEQLRSYADQAITLDLDDGVKTNYAKFGPLVAEAKKIYGTKDD
jgi:hypothetical protein